MAIQFPQLELRAVDLGRLRELLQDRYPEVEERAPVPLQVENFARGHRLGMQFQFALMERPPIPMLIFTSVDRSSLVQVQGDRFACAWRRTDTVDYPQYETLRQDFVRNAVLFGNFVEEVCGVDIKVTQAEVSYVNDIPMSDGIRPDVLAKALPSLYSHDSARPEISAVNISQRLTFRTTDRGGGVDYARLHIDAEPVLTDHEPVLRLSLLYRGEPYERDQRSPGLAPLMGFFDEGHDQIVRGFAANTTEEAHRLWGRIA
ncbi:TIGR04255 family protein [Micromonospora sp. ATA51]|nr:TIGR04255 family protein [Micromonospora sp. ATA51]